MKIFYALLANSLVAFLNNTLRLVCPHLLGLSRDAVGGRHIGYGGRLYSVPLLCRGFSWARWSIAIGREPAMLLSSVCSLLLYVLACIISVSTSPRDLHTVLPSPILWALYRARAAPARSLAISAQSRCRPW